MSDYSARFGGIARLYSKEGLERLRRAHVCVVGIGGVGSWAVEALARSGIGELTLIDIDDVCTSNINRQLPATDLSIGRTKIEVMAERIKAINPDCVVHPRLTLFTASNANELLSSHYDYVLDAIDNIANKSLLIGLCHQRGIPIVTTGGAGGLRDPSRIQVVDLAQTTYDRLLMLTRTELRKHYRFPRGPKVMFGVDAVFSPEPPVYPQPDGSVCEQRDEGSDLRLNCDSGYGTATFVTGAFGFAAASIIVRKLVTSNLKQTIEENSVARG